MAFVNAYNCFAPGLCCGVCWHIAGALQAMGLMLPRSGDCPENRAKSSLEGKLDCMSLNGYGTCARENVDLNRYSLFIAW